MPVMDGVDVARAMKANSPIADTPIIMLSSSHDVLSPADRAQCGISIAMTKPVRQSRLFDSIVNVLQAQIEGDKADARISLSSSPPVAVPEIPPALPMPVAASEPWATSATPLTSDFGDAGGGQKKPADSPIPASVLPVPSPVSDSMSGTVDVLVTEDNHVNQIVVQQMLKSLGFSSELAENGSEAIEKLQRTPFRVVLMDGHMPVMDGIKATNAIRKMQEMGQLPLNTSTDIVALTANVCSSAKDEFLRAGVGGFLSKPVTLERLKGVLSKYSEDSCPAGETAVPRAPLSKPEPTLVPSPSLVPEPSANAALYDDRDFASRFGNDESFKRQVLSLMQSSLPRTLGELKEAADSGDFAHAAGVAHRLKGAAGDSALPAVGASAAAIESAAKKENATDVGLSLIELNALSLIHI